MSARAALGVALALAGCGSDERLTPGTGPLPSLPALADEDPSPAVLEVTLRAHPARKTYPGSKPSEV